MTYSSARRNFLKLSVRVLYALSVPFVTMLRRPKDAAGSNSEDDVFVIWNGWVLRKTDLEHIEC